MQIGDHIALLDDGALAWHGKCNELHRTTHPIMRQFVECTRTHTIGVNPGHP
jgi:ABC-type transporter Mla maintaining outer membrane lipid asymmetry ATPase subunit MlaF